MRERISKDDGRCRDACALAAPHGPIILRGSLRSRLRMTGLSIRMSFPVIEYEESPEIAAPCGPVYDQSARAFPPFRKVNLRHLGYREKPEKKLVFLNPRCPGTRLALQGIHGRKLHNEQPEASGR